MARRLPRAVVFDFDGTLVDSNAIKREAFFAIARELDGAAALLEGILAEPAPRDRGAVFAELYARLPEALRLGLPADQPARWTERYSAHCARAVLEAPEIAGAGAALARLDASGVALFVSSLTPKAALEPLLRGRGLMPPVRGCFGAPSSKAESLAAIAAGLRAQPSEILMVGDGRPDAEGARAFGCPLIAIGPEAAALAAPGELWLPDLVDLPAVLGLSSEGEPLASAGPVRSP